MVEAPVTKFVAKNRNNLFRFALFDQGIVDNNVLVPRQSVEISVAMSAPLASVDDMEFLKRELELGRKILDTGLQRTRFQGGELIEQGQNSNWVDRDRKDLDTDSKEPEIVEEASSGLLDDFQNTTDDRSAENNAQHLALQHIRDP